MQKIINDYNLYIQKHCDTDWKLETLDLIIVFLSFLYKQEWFDNEAETTSFVIWNLLIELCDNIRWIKWCYMNNWYIAWRSIVRRMIELCSTIACICEDKDQLEKKCKLYDEYRIFISLKLWKKWVIKNPKAKEIIKKHQEKHNFESLEKQYQMRHAWWFKELGITSPKKMVEKYHYSDMNSILNFYFPEYTWKANEIFKAFDGLFTHPNAYTFGIVPEDQRNNNNTCLNYVNKTEYKNTLDILIILIYTAVFNISNIINKDIYKKIYSSHILKKHFDGK